MDRLLELEFIVRGFESWVERAKPVVSVEEESIQLAQLPKNLLPISGKQCNCISGGCGFIDEVSSLSGGS